jgi:hypothetical protein
MRPIFSCINADRNYLWLTSLRFLRSDMTSKTNTKICVETSHITAGLLRLLKLQVQVDQFLDFWMLKLGC